jgi:hypothetical protein
VRCERSPYIGMYLLYSNYPRIKNEHWATTWTIL